MNTKTMPSLLHLVTGGCKSGKSAYAQSLAESLSDTQTYIATAEARDESMATRIEEHKAVRGNSWTTFELIPRLFFSAYKTFSEPMHCSFDTSTYSSPLHKSIHSCYTIVPPDLVQGVILFDCLTLFLSGQMECALTKDNLSTHLDLLLAQITRFSVPVIMVTNEVGLGGISSHASAREFCDIAGLANQYIAQRAHSVTFVVSGIPMVIKGAVSHK